MELVFGRCDFAALAMFYHLRHASGTAEAGSSGTRSSVADLAEPMHLALNLPEVKRVTRPPVRRSNDRPEVGLRAVNLVPRADGSTELRLITADPNVVILLPVVERTIQQ